MFFALVGGYAAVVIASPPAPVAESNGADLKAVAEVSRLVIENHAHTTDTIRNFAYFIVGCGTLAAGVAGFLGFRQANRFREIERDARAEMELMKKRAEEIESARDDLKKELTELRRERSELVVEANRNLEALLDIIVAKNAQRRFDPEDPEAADEVIFDLSKRLVDDDSHLWSQTFVQAHGLHAWVLKRRGSFELALQHLGRAVERVGEEAPQHQHALLQWNFACYSARVADQRSAGNRPHRELDQQALDALERAVELEPKFTADLTTDSDLDQLRIRARDAFLALVARHQTPQAHAGG